jgi:hypothetical protein
MTRRWLDPDVGEEIADRLRRIVENVQAGRHVGETVELAEQCLRRIEGD